MDKSEAKRIVHRCALERADESVTDYLVFPEMFEEAKKVLGEFEALDVYWEEVRRIKETELDLENEL